jgi:hypothetical protein
LLAKIERSLYDYVSLANEPERVERMRDQVNHARDELDKVLLEAGYMAPEQISMLYRLLRALEDWEGIVVFLEELEEARVRGPLEEAEFDTSRHLLHARDDSEALAVFLQEGEHNSTIH